jgi:hypothetical protein
MRLVLVVMVALLARGSDAFGQRLLWRQPVMATIFAETREAVFAVVNRVVVLVTRGGLQGRDLQTGRLLWSVLKPFDRILVGGDNLVFVGDVFGTLYALEVRRGTLRWRVDGFGRVYQLVIHRSLLLVVSSAKGGTALELATGRLRWSRPEESGIEAANEFGVIWRRPESGAITLARFSGVHPINGRDLWSASAQSGWIYVRGRTAWIDRRFGSDFTDGVNPLLLSRYDLPTGARAELQINFSKNREGLWPIVERMESDGTHLVWLEDTQARPPLVSRRLEIIRLDLRGTRLTRAFPPNTTWWTGPVGGRILLSDDRHVYGIKTTNGTRVNYLELNGAVVSDLEVIGGRVLVSLEQGQLLGFDIVSAEPVFRSPTRLECDCRFVLVGDTLLVNTESEVIALGWSVSPR